MMNVLWMRMASFQEVMQLLGDAWLFFNRLNYEAKKEALPPEVKEAADRLPSLQDLLRDDGAILERGEHSVRLLPWTDDDGSTQFAVDVFHAPKGGETENVAQLGTYQVKIAHDMLHQLQDVLVERGDQ